jgi:dsRNA-specific ribonuclease
MAQYYLTRSEFKSLKRLPTILSQLERAIRPMRMITEFKLEVPSKSLVYFNAATTYPCAQVGYDYETLETFGDSVMKYLISHILYIQHPEKAEGDLVVLRSQLINNNKLYQLAETAEIYNYITSNQLLLNTWDGQFVDCTKKTLSHNVTKKSLADVLEAIVGACMYTEKGFKNCLKLMDKVKIIPKDIDEKYLKEVYRQCRGFNNSILLTEKDIEQSVLAEKIKLNEILPQRIHIDSSQLCSCPLIAPNSNANKFILNDSHISSLEELLGYTFKNKHLLVIAFTHGSVNSTYSYERQEFLGDALLEIYLVLNIYNINKNNIHSISDINASSVTRAKSLLASNNYLIKICIMFGLYRYLSIDRSGIPPLKQYIDSFDPNQYINEYGEDVIARPKVLSDIVEALIGAIFLDSDLEQCFKCLDLFYRDSLIYIAKYINNIKYSPVAEFDILCKAQFGIPSFHCEAGDGVYTVTISVNGILISTGEAGNKDRAKDIAAINGLEYIKVNGRNI